MTKLWNFDNSYKRLPKHFYAAVHPVGVQNPSIVILNDSLAKALGLKLDEISKETLASILSGNRLTTGSEPIAQAYSGHQFGYFTTLGDGRAHLLGEHITPENARFDIQLKGSGKTPYGRSGDGRACLGPMLREYIISEAMHALNVPTTRSLAVVTTGEDVRRETLQQGAILTRIAKSHLRIGTFQHFSSPEDLRCLADYAIDRHFLSIKDTKEPYLGLLQAVVDSQIALVNDWMRIGFIHGVMNTDNTSIAGETIDYGPCAFMDAYDPKTCFSAIDTQKRYAYASQPTAIRWNLLRFAEALLPLLHQDRKKAIDKATALMEPFADAFRASWYHTMTEKLGLKSQDAEDQQIVHTLLSWMHANQADYTNTFWDLSQDALPERSLYKDKDFIDWHKRWQSRTDDTSKARMHQVNPWIVPRNHQVEKALSDAEKGEFSTMHTLLKALETPYTMHEDYTYLQNPPTDKERVKNTFCGT